MGFHDNRFGEVIRSLKTRVDKLEQGDTSRRSGLDSSEYTVTPIEKSEDVMNGSDTVSITVTTG